MFRPIPGARRLLLILALVAAAAVAVPVRPAAAQGTMGVLPDPISTSELSGYGSRLRLSDQQWQAVEAFHDEYKSEFRRLREGEIAEFLRSMQAFQGSGGFPPREVLEQFLERMDELNGRIASMDRRLFDRLLPILSDEQVAALPRVRLARERARYKQQEMLSMGGGSLVDVSAMVFELKLDPAEQAQADVVLVPYEKRVTTIYEKLAKKAGRMWLDMYDAILARGFDETSMQDPEKAAEMMEAMQQILEDVAAPTVERAAEITEENARAFRALRSALAPVHAGALRRQFISQAYPRAGEFAAMDLVYFDRFVRAAEPTPEQAQTVAELLAAAQADFDRITDEAMDAIDEARKGRSPFQPQFNDGAALTRTLDDLRRQAATRLRRTAEALAAALEDERLLEAVHALPEGAELTQIGTALATIEAAAAAPDATAGDTESAQPMPPVQIAQVDPLVPRAITAREVEKYAAALELDEGDRAIATEMHRRYREQFQALHGAELKSLQSAVMSAWQADPETGRLRGLSDAEIDELLRKRRAAFQAVTALDDELFANLALTFDDDERAAALARLREARRRQTYGVPITARAMFDQSVGTAALIDLSELLARVPGPEAATVRESVLPPYEMRLTELLAARYDVALECQRAMDHYLAGTARLQSDEEVTPDDWMRLYREILGPASKRAEAADAPIIALNEEWVSKLADALPEEAMARLRDLHRRSAFPHIFNAYDSTEQRLAAALALPDLTDAQRTALQELSLEYTPALAALNDQLVALARQAPSMDWFTEGEDVDWQAVQEHQSRQARLEFERGELDERAAARLRRILREDQLARLGGVRIE